MPRTMFKGTNHKYGIIIDADGTGGLTDEKFIVGQRFTKEFTLAAANIPQLMWTAPYPCKMIRFVARHVTVAGQAGTLVMEKTTSGVAPGSGTTCTAALDLVGTANTNITVLPLATAASIFAVGDSLGTKLGSGAATSYAGGLITCVMEFI